ncbi:hypothetical protein BCR44DRAFT_58006 [Catenaria anguillulae PL171]|uniref:Phosphoinositide phospholipase C n=1 Tax=Catenaria anguillulae PL171 TaxID=765915 RepID=A0A1Y2HDI2_9FUNG|nr:hypothetical protein BCR44DRAFT_58006 [Catenaria anguillulae PL171]
MSSFFKRLQKPLQRKSSNRDLVSSSSSSASGSGHASAATGAAMDAVIASSPPSDAAASMTSSAASPLVYSLPPTLAPPTSAPGNALGGPAATLPQASADDQHHLRLDPSLMVTLDMLSAGIVLKKADRKAPGSMKDRVFKLDVLKRHLRWSSKRKPPELTTILIDDIQEIRQELSFSLPAKATEKEPLTDRCLSIHYLAHHTGEPKILDLVFPTPTLRSTLVNVIEGLQSHAASLDGRDYILFLINTWIHRAWAATDANADGKIGLDETLAALKLFNVALSKDQIRRLFAMYDRTGQGWLDLPSFSKMCLHLKRSPDVVRVFDQLTGGKDGSGQLDWPGFRQFLVAQQRERDLSEYDAQNLFMTYSIPRTSGSPTSGSGAPADPNDWAMDVTAFHIYLLSPHNAALDKRDQSVHMDMTRPMSHYFISSSHNTYLVGNQLNSESSVEAYVRVLQRGGRCVELDCWDGPHDDPVIYHGHTRTTKILLRDVLQAVAKYAFVASDYPLVLSLEMHCGYVQQGKVAYYLRNILGSALVTAKVGDGPETALPSPEALKRRILVKGKGFGVGESAEETEWKKSAGSGGQQPSPRSRTISLPTAGSGSREALPTTSSVPMNDRPASPTQEQVGTAAPGSPTSPAAKRMSVVGIPSPLALSSVTDDPATELPSTGSRHVSTPDLIRASSPPPPQQQQQQVVAASVSGSPSSYPNGNGSTSAKESSSASSSQHPDLLALAVYMRAVKFTGPASASETTQPASSAATGTASSSPEPRSRDLDFGASSMSTSSAASSLSNGSSSGNTLFCTMSSFSESAYLKHARTSLSAMHSHTSQRLARVYPGGLRVGSSNFNPFPFWAAGAQMVALNWQTFDSGMSLQAGFFARNGGCGYVLKPEYMINQAAPRPPAMTLTIQIMSGNHLPKSKGKIKGEVIDPFVVAEVFDAPMTKPPTSAAAPPVVTSPTTGGASAGTPSSSVASNATSAVPAGGAAPIATSAPASTSGVVSSLASLPIAIPPTTVGLPAASFALSNSPTRSLANQGSTSSLSEAPVQWSSPSVPVGSSTATSTLPSATAIDGQFGPPLTEQAVFTYRTATVQNNGWNPSWNETFAVRITNRDLAMIRFTVYDSDVGSNEFVGCFAAPVHCLRQGYRHLYLRNWKGKPSSDATLLVHITID